MRGVDFATQRPGGAAIRAAGFEFVIRYAPWYPGEDGHGLSAAEVADYHANGLAIGIVWETSAGRVLDGWAAGALDARLALAGLASLGFPDELPIYFACDRDVTPADFIAIDAYLIGAASVLGLERVGIYGEFEVIEHCHVAGTATWFWQCRAWSGKPVQLSPWRHLYQEFPGGVINGQGVDFNEAYGTEQGLWKPEEDSMTADEVRAIAIQAIKDGLRQDHPDVPGIVGPDSFLELLAQALGIHPNTFKDENGNDVQLVGQIRDFHKGNPEKPQAGSHSHTPAEIPHGHGDAQ